MTQERSIPLLSLCRHPANTFGNRLQLPGVQRRCKYSLLSVTATWELKCHAANSLLLFQTRESRYVGCPTIRPRSRLPSFTKGQLLLPSTFTHELLTRSGSACLLPSSSLLRPRRLAARGISPRFLFEVSKTVGARASASPSCSLSLFSAHPTCNYLALFLLYFAVYFARTKRSYAVHHQIQRPSSSKSDILKAPIARSGRKQLFSNITVHPPRSCRPLLYKICCCRRRFFQTRRCSPGP